MRKPIAFISHSSQDKDLATQLASDLREHGIEVWIDHERIRFGDSIPGKISDGLAECDVLLVLVSQHFIDSSWCRAEYEPLIKKEIEQNETIVIPIRLDKASFPPLLASKRYLNFTRGINEYELKHLCTEIIDGISYKRLEPVLPADSEHTSSRHWSMLQLVVSKLVDGFPVSRIASESLLRERTLLDLYRAIDWLIDDFLQVFDEITRILAKYGGRDLYFPRRATPEELNDIGIANRKLLSISRHMRDISSSLDGILEDDSDLRTTLTTVAQVCTTISEVEGNLVFKFGAPAEVPSENDVAEDGFLGENRVIHNYNNTPGLPILEWGAAFDANLLEDYRTQLREAIAAAASSKA